MSKKSILLGATAFGLLLPIAPASAQDSESDYGEIIVTARKRQESILKVPVVQTVLTQERLERTQVSNINDISKMAPGLVLGQSTNEIGTQVSIRGIGTTSLDPGIDQSVLLNIDGLSLSQGMAYSVGVFDMQQVEVLKGPQALFFGKNSPAGVISIRTADPGDELEIIGRTAYEIEANEFRNEAIISGPVTDTLGLRLAAMYSDMDGFFRNTGVAAPGTGAVQLPYNFGATKTLFLRGTVVFEPMPAFRARLKLNYTRDRNKGGAGFQLASCPDGAVPYLPNTVPFAGIGMNFFSPNENCELDRNVNIVGMSPSAFAGSGPGGEIQRGGSPFTDITQKFGSLELDYDFSPELTLTSVTGYYDLSTDTLLNCFFAGGAAPGCAADKDLQRKEFTQELRLNSDFSGPLNFTVGGFYQDAELTTDNDQLLLGNGAYGFPPFLFQGSQDVDIKSRSVFGQLRYQVVPQLEIAAGVRWTHETRTSNPETVDLFGAFTGVPGTRIDVDQPKLDSKKWSPELTITYTPTDDLTFFASAKQGYKSGSYNIVQPANPGTDKSFGDERIRGGEVGMKGRFMDRQLNVNLAGYYYKYAGLQVGINTPSLGLPTLRTVNAAGAKIYGVDFDMSYRPRSVPGLEVSGSVNYNHGRFTSFVGAPCGGGQSFEEGCTLLPAPIPANDPYPDVAFVDPVTGDRFRYSSQDLSGLRLTRAPDWAGTLAVNYELETAVDSTINFGASAQYSSSYLTNLSRRPEYIQGSYVKFNANVSFAGPDKGWEMAMIGNNLANKLTTGTCLAGDYAGSVGVFGNPSVFGAPTSGPSGQEEVFCAVDRGREIWFRLTLRPTALFGR